MNTYIQELESLSSDNVYSMAKIEWWLLKYQDEYKRIKEAESKRFMYLIEGEWVRLPDYINARTDEEKFLNIYNTIDEISDFHRNESYFKQEIAIYKGIKEDPEKVIKWLAKNEEIGATEYCCFSLDYFGDEDEYENDIHLQLFFLEDKDRVVFIHRNDFKYTLEFLRLFNIYWELLEDLNVSDLTKLK